jgi:hypothetical protein
VPNPLESLLWEPGVRICCLPLYRKCGNGRLDVVGVQITFLRQEGGVLHNLPLNGLGRQYARPMTVDQDKTCSAANDCREENVGVSDDDVGKHATVQSQPGSLLR